MVVYGMSCCRPVERNTTLELLCLDCRKAVLHLGDAPNSSGWNSHCAIDTPPAEHLPALYFRPSAGETGGEKQLRPHDLEYLDPELAFELQVIVTHDDGSPQA